MMVYYYASQMGTLYIGMDEEQRLTRMGFTEEAAHTPHESLPPALHRVFRELDEYFAGRRSRFELSYTVEGTELFKRAWTELVEVPLGTTISYSELARRTGAPKAVRAVASAVARNPLPIIIPCHRVLPKDGSVGLYAYRSLGKEHGSAIKAQLLAHEAAIIRKGDLAA